MSRTIDPHEAIDYIIKNAGRFANARAERVYIEEYRKSLKALLMQRSGQKVIAAQERDAYAHEEYAALLAGLREAVEVEEKLRWDLIAAQARIEVWRSQEATNRSQDKLAL
jgi:hypothetical protein